MSPFLDGAGVVSIPDLQGAEKPGVNLRDGDEWREQKWGEQEREDGERGAAA